MTEHEYTSFEVEIKPPFNETFLLIVTIIIIMVCVNEICPYNYWPIVKLLYNNWFQ